MDVLMDEMLKHDINSKGTNYTPPFTGDFLNLDKRDPNEATSSSSSSEEGTAMRGFLVRPGIYACQSHDVTMRN